VPINIVLFINLIKYLPSNVPMNLLFSLLVLLIAHSLGSRCASIAISLRILILRIKVLIHLLIDIAILVGYVVINFILVPFFKRYSVLFNYFFGPKCLDLSGFKILITQPRIMLFQLNCIFDFSIRAPPLPKPTRYLLNWLWLSRLHLLLSIWLII